jgi:hypothetical protein
VAEWSIAPVLKTGNGQPFVSSNLTASARPLALERISRRFLFFSTIISTNRGRHWSGALLGTRSVISRLHADDPGESNEFVRFEERRPGEIITALEGVERSALYCQSLISTFVQSARDAHPGATPQSVSAGSVARALLDEFPFERDERTWVSSNVTEDFMPLGRRDLIYLALCTLTKNALLALRGRPNPSLRIEVGHEDAHGQRYAFMRFIATTAPGSLRRFFNGSRTSP